MEELLKAPNSPAPRRRTASPRTATKENGPIVINCKESVSKSQRKLGIEVGIRHFKKEHRKNHFSVLITRFHVSADFNSGTVEDSEPRNTLNTPLGELTQRMGTSNESEQTFGPELKGGVFSVLGSLKARRAAQAQNEVKRGIRVVEVLTAEPTGQRHTVTWLIKLHSPAALAKFLNGSEDSATSVLDYYTGFEHLKARAAVDSTALHTAVSVIIDCDSIIFLKHRSDSRFSAFWESVTLYETIAKRQLKRLFGNYQKRAFIKCTLQ